MKRRLWEEQKNKIILYLYDQTGREICIEESANSDNAYYPEENTISLCSRQNFVSRLHTLLHESGHVLLRFERQVPLVRLKSGIPNKNERIDILREEVLAWSRGKAIASEMNIIIDNEKYEQHCRKHIYDYINWVLQPRQT